MTATNSSCRSMLVYRAFNLFISTCYIARLSASIQWPAGSYGIPKASSGCPEMDGFQWESGWRYQDTRANSRRSSGFHMDGTVDHEGVNRSFCIKSDTRNDMNRSSWPSGKYCMYKSGACPPNTSAGFVYWDDDSFAGVANYNKKGGTLPDGTYGSNTKIEFCCRTDGNKKHPVTLPTSSPFYLLAYESAECQQVKWATASVEWILFDNEDFINNDDQKGSYPYGAGINNKQHDIHYCFYQGCNKTFNDTSGTFQSPNYPNRYSDGQYCSWRIMVMSNQKVHLIFTNFSFQVEKNTDGVYVYNGENETGELLGVYYGGHPPPQEGIYSSSNRLFVIFQSDNSRSFTGFNASYSAVNYSEPTSYPTSSPTRKMTSSHKESEGIPTSGASSVTSVTGTGDTQENQHGTKSVGHGGGVNVTAIVISLVGCVLAACVVGSFIYLRRRKRRTKDSNAAAMFQSLTAPSSVSVNNPSYERSMASENVLYMSQEGLGITYSEVKGKEKDSLGLIVDEETENPLYEGNYETNPIYESTP